MNEQQWAEFETTTRKRFDCLLEAGKTMSQVGDTKVAYIIAAGIMAMAAEATAHCVGLKAQLAFAGSNDQRN